MFKGPKGPNSGRTPRSIAEEKNDAGNFEEGPAYDVAGGHPIKPGMPAQEYKEREMKSSGGGSPINIPAPFTLGSK